MEGDRVELTPEGFERVLSGEVFADNLQPEEILILRAIQSYEARDLGGAPEDHLEKILDWGEQALQQQALLNMVLRGELYVIWKDEEDDVCFSLTPLGVDRAGRSGLDVSAMDMPSLDE